MVCSALLYTHAESRVHAHDDVAAAYLDRKTGQCSVKVRGHVHFNSNENELQCPHIDLKNMSTVRV